MANYTSRGQRPSDRRRTALMRSSQRESWLITRVDTQAKVRGIAQPDRREDNAHWNRVVAKRRYEYKPLDDAVYTARFQTLCYRYHPAVAAVLAHDVSNGPGCYNTRSGRAAKPQRDAGPDQVELAQQAGHLEAGGCVDDTGPAETDPAGERHEPGEQLDVAVDVAEHGDVEGRPGHLPAGLGGDPVRQRHEGEARHACNDGRST